MVSFKEHNDFQFGDIKEIEIYEFPDREFKVLSVWGEHRYTTKFRKIMHEQKKFNWEIKDYKKQTIIKQEICKK
jgi:uncharacterized membrane protein YbaN (DUF454 family)